jgi:hypothetical protein
MESNRPWRHVTKAAWKMPSYPSASASTGLAFGQTQVVVTSQDAQGNIRIQRRDGTVGTITAQERARFIDVAQRMSLGMRVIRETGAHITADRLERRGAGVYAQGNVRLRFSDVVVTADDAEIQGGEIRLGSNARITAPPK